MVTGRDGAGRWVGGAGVGESGGWALDGNGKDVYVLAPSERDLGGIVENEGGVSSKCDADAVENELMD